jgi:hypothetical protein
VNSLLSHGLELRHLLAGRIGTRSGLDAEGRLRKIPPSPGRNRGTPTTRPPCRAPAARRARGAERERARSRMQRRRVRAGSA